MLRPELDSHGVNRGVFVTPAWPGSKKAAEDRQRDLAPAPNQPRLLCTSLFSHVLNKDAQERAYSSIVRATMSFVDLSSTFCMLVPF